MTTRSPSRATTSLLALFGAVSLLGPAAARAERPSISVRPDVGTPGFRWAVGDYALRCAGEPVRVRVSGAKGWLTSAGGGEPTPGGAASTVARAGKRVRVAMQRRGSQRIRRYSLRCLPADFPEYRFTRVRRGGPELFSMQLTGHYAAIFDGDGVPIWWYAAEGRPADFQVLADGTVTYAPVDAAAPQASETGFVIRTIDGRLLRILAAAGGLPTDFHEIELLPNGDYVLGGQTEHAGVDASAFGYGTDETVSGIEVQELTKRGELVSSWDPYGKIDLAETGRWWQDPAAIGDPGLDVVHWNAADVRGNRMLLSFRHLDAVYEINTRTGDIVWKLGGTETRDSLAVRGDERGDYPLGGQHDARYGPDGTITIYDNSSALPEARPRAVRYRIDEAAGTARLVDELTDPDVPTSYCCGSARPTEDGGWLIGWGGNGYSAAYDSRGRRIYSIETPGGFSYRTLPVPAGAVSERGLRRGMDRIGRR